MPSSKVSTANSRRTASNGSASSITITSADSMRGAYDRAVSPPLTVVGSINLDLVARVERLPRAGETLSGATLERIPGGKGANQAVAAARLGAQVRMVGAVGDDVFGTEAVVGLQAAGVELQLTRAGTTGVALILVAEDGENQIVVIPGANERVEAVSPGGAVLCQLEVPDEVVRAAARGAGFFALNA